MTNKLVDRSPKSIPKGIFMDDLQSVTMKTLDSWLLIQIASEGSSSIKGMKMKEKEAKFFKYSNRIDTTY
jgi:hypothetical protein